MANITQTPELTTNEKDSRRELFGTVAPADVPERILTRREEARTELSQKRKNVRRTAGAIAGFVAAGALIGSQADSEYQYKAPEPAPKEQVQPPAASSAP